MKWPDYLGDGVYAHIDEGGIVLTTGHHDPALATNVIVIEPAVLNAFESYVAKARARLSFGKSI
jgi:hypothetical protein